MARYLICNDPAIDLVVKADGKHTLTQHQSRHQLVQVNNIRSTYISCSARFVQLNSHLNVSEDSLQCPFQIVSKFIHVHEF